MDHCLELHRKFLPKREELAALEAQAGHVRKWRSWCGSERLANVAYSRFLGRGLEFEEVRAYSPGDDIRSMEWKVTARTGRPHVKVYREEHQQVMILVMDVSAGMLFGSAKTTKLAQAVRVASWLAFATMNRGDRAGALLCGDPGGLEIPPSMPREMIWRMLDFLSSDSSDYCMRRPMAWRRLLGAMPPGRLVVVLSDFMNWGDDDWRGLKQVAARHRTMAVRIFDPRECGMPDIGPVRVAGPLDDTPFLIDTASRRGREAYAACWKAHLEDLRRHFSNTYTPCWPVSTADDPAIRLGGLAGLLRL